MAEQFSRTPVPVPPPAGGQGYLRPDQLPGEGRPPLPTGRVIMTDYVREQLTKLGWQEGQPFPGDLGQRIKEIQEEIAEDRRTAKPNVPEGWVPPKAKLVDIADLPEEKQAELRQYLVDYQRQKSLEAQANAAEQSIEASIPPGTPPDVAEATRVAMRAQQNALQAQMPTARVVNTGPPAGTQIPDGKVYGGAMGEPSIAEKLAAATKLQQEHEAAPTTPQPPEHESAGGKHNPVFCPRCLWDLKMPFDAHPTEFDKKVFMAAIITQSRFEQRIEMLGGKLVVTFRSLTAKESSKLNQQLGLEIREGRILGDGEFFAMTMEYRLAMSVAKIEAQGSIQHQVPTLDEFTKDNDKVLGSNPTGIPALREWFYDNVATQEPIRRVLGQHHRQFQRVVEALEAMTSEPDFWEGIEPLG